MLPSATLTTVLSRNVTNRTMHSTARAMDRPPCRTDAASPSEMSTGLTTLASARAGGRQALKPFQLEQSAEASHAHLPGSVLQYGGARLIRQRNRPTGKNVVLYRCLTS